MRTHWLRRVWSGPGAVFALAANLLCGAALGPAPQESDALREMRWEPVDLQASGEGPSALARDARGPRLAVGSERGVVVVEVGGAAQMTVQGWQIGRAIFGAVAFAQMTLVLLLVPSVSASAITAERDKATLVPLLVTPMRRSRIASGKLLAPILYVFLLLSTSIPFAALSFGFGGTDPAMLGATYACLATTALSVAALGLAVSTIMRRTVPAVLLAYGIVAAVVVGSGIAEVFLHVLISDLEGIYFVYLNPFTPLVLYSNDAWSAETGVSLHWWITPLLQLVLGAACASLAWHRIRKMRD